ncbi:MAG: PAS domain S-box protein [Methylococcaceae bacterium]|nr:PAS domain S-box protein [Methylococcaceae bacterium]
MLSKINEGLALTKSNGIYNVLYDKWFGIYEDNQVGLRDLLKFIIPIVIFFLGIMGYFFYQRKVERKAAQDFLKDRENHLRLSQMDGGIGTWEADLLTNRQTCSANCFALFGLPVLSEPTWKDFLAIVHPDDRQRVIDATTSHLEYGTNYEVEYRTTLPNGEICWMRSAGQVERDTDGKPIRMRGIVQNITERKLAEDKLKENEHKLSEILESVEASIYLKDIQGRYLFANRRVRELFGAAMEEIVGQSDERFFAAETIIQLRNNDRLVMEEGRTIKTEETNLNLKDGKISTYLSTKLPLRNEAGEIYALCGISTDITDRKQLEKAQEEVLIRLQKITSRVPGIVYQYRLRTDGSACFPFASEAIREIYRVKPEEVCEDASKVFAILHPDDYDEIAASIQESARDLTPWRHEYRVKFDDGTFRWLFGDAVPEREADGSTLWHGYVTDITERKQAEEKHRVSELALKAISQGVIISSADRRIRWVNNAFESITGYSNAEILGKTCRFLQGPLTDPSTVKAMSFALGNVTEFSGEVLNYRKDGTVFWNELMISPVRDEQGQLTHFIGVSRDITERKRYEMLIRENEQRLLEILNVSPIAVRIAINQGREVVFYNQRYTDLIKNALAMGDDPRSYYARVEDYQEILTELMNGRVVLNRQIELRIPDGSTLWVLGSYMPMNYQGKDAVLGWFYDITERIEAQKALTRQLELLRKAEETLRIANEEQHAIFDSATSGIVLIKDGIIQRCNRKLENIFGYASGELEGKPVRLWYTDETAYETDGRPVYKAITYGKFHRLEQQLIRKDGSLFWARLSGIALDYDDPAKGMVGVIDDITLEHEATEALLKGKAMAEEATRTKSEFLANMSHEIRTPMNGVLGMLDLLRETKMTLTQRDWVETAHSSAEALLEIINDILDLTKLEAGKFEVEQVDFNLVDLVEDICALLAGRAHKKGLELNCLLPVPMPLRWQGDPMRIRQVLTNLIGNAVKFTQQGEVSVNVNMSSLTDNQNGLRFEVHDTGIGIPEAAQLQLFQPFSQADSATSRRFGGSGLGLFISKKLVELMGGAIGLSSIPGKGSCFWFTLPLDQSEHQDTLMEHYDLSGKRALIVDDNATNRNILNNYLGRWGLEVSEVDNGSAALMALQTSAIQGVIYDLILLDMQMPVMDGLTLAKCLAQIPALAKIPVILLSSSDQFDLVDYQSTGILQCLMKPVRQMQLFDAIVNALQGVSEAGTNPAEPETQLPSYNGKKVLVVEDNKINQKVIIAKLAKFGIEPDLAENGHAALDKLAQSAYDLIFMDCHMPVMDGYTATRELRLLEASKGLPHQTVIALTANALEGDLEKCLEAGMDDYLSKPIVSGQLMDILACRLGNQNDEIHPALLNENISPAEKGMIVWDEAAALKHLEGDSDLLYEMIALYLVEGPKQLRDLSRFQAEGNLLALANTAHAIKGTTAHFYADTATACASLLEQTARSNQPADFQGMTEALVMAVTDLINTLQLAKNAKKQIS